MMNAGNSKVITLIGGALLAVGVFMPLVRVPKLGTISYFNNGSGDGVIVLLLAGAAIALALFGLVKHAIWPGLASLAMIGIAFVRLQTRLAEMQSGVAAGLDDNPFAEVAARSIQMEFGWAILVFGALMVIVGGAMAWRSGGRSGGL